MTNRVLGTNRGLPNLEYYQPASEMALRGVFHRVRQGVHHLLNSNAQKDLDHNENFQILIQAFSRLFIFFRT